MNSLLKHIGFILILLVFTNCKSKKGLIKSSEAADIEALTKAASVIDLVKEKDFKFEWLSAKIKTKYKTSDGKSQSFKTYLRIRKDSAIWATVTFLNVPIMTTIMTPDSVKIINKKDKKYFLGTFDFITNFVKTPIDFYQIQNLFVGNPISLDTTNPHYLVDLNDDIYLSSVKKSELEPILKEEKVYFGWIYRYWINELYRPGKTILNNPGNGNSLIITQNDYKKADNMSFPNRTEALFVSQKDTVEIKLNYSKIKTNEAQSMPFKITSKYTPYENGDNK
jgi:hypothetical protein